MIFLPPNRKDAKVGEVEFGVSSFLKLCALAPLREIIRIRKRIFSRKACQERQGKNPQKKGHGLPRPFLFQFRGFSLFSDAPPVRP
ncbi:MAG: hypothetical protein ACXWZE_22510, partial [Candidatus Binatia bacterium]